MKLRGIHFFKMPGCQVSNYALQFPYLLSVNGTSGSQFQRQQMNCTLDSVLSSLISCNIFSRQPSLTHMTGNCRQIQMHLLTSLTKPTLPATLPHNIGCTHAHLIGNPEGDPPNCMSPLSFQPQYSGGLIPESFENFQVLISMLDNASLPYQPMGPGVP